LTELAAKDEGESVVNVAQRDTILGLVQYYIQKEFQYLKNVNHENAFVENVVLKDTMFVPALLFTP
jgi:hypothetical protein